MPPTAAGYVHRIGRTGRAHNTGTSVSLVSSSVILNFEKSQDHDTYYLYNRFLLRRRKYLKK
jgi:superfamily II DNA/RNA helicase